MNIFNLVNSSIAGAVIAIGVFLKSFLKDKKIKNFEVKRLLPLFILIVSEIINIAYGLTQGENIVVSISNGFISTFVSTYGYDVVKSIVSKGNKDLSEDK